MGLLNNKSVTHFVFDFELASGLSTFCHEMGHMIGAPDYYHYSDSTMGNHEPWASVSPVGRWDLMSNDNAQFWSAYTKWKYGGWFPAMTEITPTSYPLTYSLTAIDESPYSCYKIASSEPNQYYVLEYRRKNGDYDIGLPGSGLVVWRVITGLNGNSQGPPDELYVYRPGGDINSNGALGDAAFCLQTGATDFNNYTDPKPWLYADTLSTPGGNLVITDIGSYGNSTIEFTIRSSIPKYWTGAVSTDWAISGNWKNGVPGAGDDAIIQAHCSHYPVINSEARCRILTVKDGSMLTIESGSLTVYDDFNNYGYLIMDDDAGSLTVLGSLKMEDTSTASVTGDVMIYIQSNLECRGITHFGMQQGTVEFIGNTNSNITSTSATVLHNLVNDKIGSTLYYSLASTYDLSVSGNFINMSGCNFNFEALQSMKLSGNYSNLGHAVWHTASTLHLMGYFDQSLRDEEASSFVGHLTIEMVDDIKVVSLLTDFRA